MMAAAEPSAAQVAHEKKRRWLEAFEQQVTVTGACRATGIPRRTVYDWRQADEAFAVAWADIELATTESMESEAVRRGRDGVEKPVFQGGKEVGRVREFSDTLLIFMLKARKPDVYRDRVSVQHSGQVDVRNLTPDKLRDLTDDELDALEAKLADEAGEP